MWGVQFSPDEPSEWSYHTSCSDSRACTRVDWIEVLGVYAGKRGTVSDLKLP